MALPMINEAREAYPGSSVTVLTPDNLGELFAKNPAVDAVLTIPTEYVHGLKAVFKIKDIVTPEDFETAYILPPSFGAASAFKLAGIDERIGYIADGRRLLLTRPLPLPEPLNSEHRSIVYFNLLRRGTGQPIEYVKPKMFLDEDDALQAAELLNGFEVKAEEKYAVIAFRAVAESRRWGITNYTKLAGLLAERYRLKVLLVGSGNDAKDGERIVGTLADRLDSGQVINLAGKTSLRELAAICSRAQVFVGNDSGPAHLAAAVGTPIVVLSGPDDPHETSPISSQKRLIYLEDLECISCVKNKCPLKGDEHMQCMTGISVEMVLDQVEQLVGPVTD
jgi:heptosyltransferase-2